jgi:lysophospholipase L1-like esterase
MKSISLRLLAHALALLPALSLAALPLPTPTVRYLSLGDSIAAGYKAQPATSGYAYQLYLGEAYGRTPETVFANAAVPGATSADVLHFQLPQVPRFAPTVVTMSVGGNDLLTLLGAAPPTPEQVGAVLTQFGGNLAQTLVGLCSVMPEGGRIYLHNLYEIPEIAGTAQVVPLFNGVMAQTVQGVAQVPVCADNVMAVADVYSAFFGQGGLLLIERFEKKGLLNTFEVHPTNKGHRVIEDLFRRLDIR